MICLQQGATAWSVVPEAAVALVRPARAVRAMTTAMLSFFMREPSRGCTGLSGTPGMVPSPCLPRNDAGHQGVDTTVVGSHALRGGGRTPRIPAAASARPYAS